MSRIDIIGAAEALAAGRPYAERLEEEPGLHDRLARWLVGATVAPLRRLVRDPVRGMERILGHVAPHEAQFRRFSDAQLQSVTRQVCARLRREGFTLPVVGECFALVREVGSRTLGRRHYDSQLIGGWCLLQGKLTEMDTGEGKTIAATLPACAVALAGIPVHVITVNDYLARRDAEEMEPLYAFLGITVAPVVQGMQKRDRRKAYAQAIAYCTNKELAFDYLRDQVALGRDGGKLHLDLRRLHGRASADDELVLRGLYFGIVDEADSIFIDEARTPLILSASVSSMESDGRSELALSFAQRLEADQDFLVLHAERRIALTLRGRETLDMLASGLEGVWSSERAREDLITQALSALHLFSRDQHYVVVDGKVQIVDESTGRVMPDRSWERGLHQLIEVKENCEPTQRRETLARLTYQRLFRRYIRLAGMTGTAREVSREIRSVYGLDVVRVPLHRPSQRRMQAPRVFATQAEKWRCVAETARRVALEDKRPVLIGTRSVRASEAISALLAAGGVEHALLNARQDKEEAAVIARAGESGRITVATNMAGRGTDIRLDPGVARRGGLHVILTEFHESRRVDRQLFGRCARQGDPGSCEAIVALDDELFAVFTPTEAAVARGLGPLSYRALEALRRLAQRRAEARGVRARLHNLANDRRLEKALAFSGKGE